MNGGGGPLAVERAVEGASNRLALRASTRIANRARAMRKAMTEPEVMLWSRLRVRAPGRPIFRRQYPVEDRAILDFYCPAAKLAVEIDGATHWSEEQQGKDLRRDRWLEGRGIYVLRIGASEVFNSLSQVADSVILLALERIVARRDGD